MLRLMRFFVVVPVVPRAMVIAFGLATLAGGIAVVVHVDLAVRTLAPVLLLQLFAAASGFMVPARRGHYDILLTRGDSRFVVAVVHWMMSVIPGILSWLVLALIERICGGTALTAPNALLALFVVSTLPWCFTLPLPRLTGGIMWLLVYALAASALPEREAAPVSLLLPWALLSAAPHPAAVAIVVACIAAAMVASFAWIARMDVALESGQ